MTTPAPAHRIYQLVTTDDAIDLVIEALRAGADQRRRAAAAAAAELRDDRAGGRDVRSDALKLLDVLADADTLAAVAAQIDDQVTAGTAPAWPPPVATIAEHTTVRQESVTPPAEPAPPATPPRRRRTASKRAPAAPAAPPAPQQQLPGDGDAVLQALTLAEGARVVPGAAPAELGPPPAQAAALAAQIRASAPQPAAGNPPGFDVYEEP